jgi:hypothetical protein
MRHKLLARVVAAVLTAFVCLVATHGSVHAQTVSPKPSPSAEDIEQAKKHMAAGVASTQDPDGARYEQAYPEFKRAYELSGSLNALQNLAICAMKLELDGEAIEYFERFLQQKGSDIDPADKEQVERDLATLKAVVAWVMVSSDRPTVTLTDTRTPSSGAPRRNRYTIGITQRKIGIHPGSHEFKAVSDEGKELTWSVEVKNGSELRHDFIFNPNAPFTAEGFPEGEGTDPPAGSDTGVEDDGEGGVHPALWVCVGVTVAAAIPWAVFMGLSASQKAEYDDEILGEKPIDEQQEAADSLKTTNLLADVFLGITAAGAAATVIVAIVTMTGGDDDEASIGGKHQGVRWTLSPAADPRGGGAVMVTGEF